MMLIAGNGGGGFNDEKIQEKIKEIKSKYLNLYLTKFISIQSELDELKEKNELRIRDILADHWKLTQAKLNEFRREILESKEYINQMHNEIDRIDRTRKRDRADIVASCLT